MNRQGKENQKVNTTFFTTDDCGGRDRHGAIQTDYFLTCGQQDVFARLWGREVRRLWKETVGFFF